MEEEMRDSTQERSLLTSAQREARKAFKQADSKVALSEYERTQEAFHANHERLKAERLAREAAANQNRARKLQI
jgi:hypothetical protein